jgi:hypothetical protein
VEQSRRNSFCDRPMIKAVLFGLAGLGIAACATTHQASTTVSTATSGRAPVVLTLSDSGHKVTLSPGADLTVDLARQAGTSDRWTLLTSGPGITETDGGTYGQSRSTPPSQRFEFRWDRTTPFGLVMILESPKKVLEPEEFAVTLEPTGYKADR